MNMNVDLSQTILPEQQKEAIQFFCKSMVSSPDSPAKSIVLYGSAARTDYRPGSSDINLLIILECADIKSLKGLIETVAAGRASGIAPLFLTTPDLLKLSTSFPLKYLSIQDSHITLYGDDPLLQITIGHEALQLRCRQELLNLLMRLRRNYLYSMGHNLTGFLTLSLKGFLEVLRIFLYLKSRHLPPRDKTIETAESLLGADVSVIREMVKVKEDQATPDADMIEAIYDRYFNLVEKIAGDI